MFGAAGQPGIKDLYRLTRVMQRLSAANIRIADSIETFIGSCKNLSLKNLLEKMLRDLQNGMTAPDAMAKYPSFFPAFMVEILRVGEQSGQIKNVLKEISNSLEQKISLQRDVNAALLVPKISLAGMFLLAGIMIFFVIPKMELLLSSLNTEMPFITRFVFGIGDIAVSFWWLFFILGVAAVAGYHYSLREYPLQIALLKMHIPFFAKITSYQIQYHFTKIFGLCIQSGINTRKSLQYVAISADNVILRTVLKKACSYMEAGESVTNAIQKADEYHIIDEAVFVMLKTAERTADLGKIMLEEANEYQKDLLVSSKMIGDQVGVTVAIPGYLILIGLLASIELPIVNLMNNINIAGGM